MSKPVNHPTVEDMELLQLEQALVLAETARERSELSVVNPTGDPKGGTPATPTGVLGGGMMGLLPLALAWEGCALALLAARGERLRQSGVLASLTALTLST